MKRYFLPLLLALFFAGCGGQPVGDREFSAVWRDYLQREFEESFDENQSISQREKILREVARNYKINFEDLRLYMMKNQPEKHKKIFLNQ